MRTRLMTLVVMMAVSAGSFGLMAQNTSDAPAQKRERQKPTPEQMMDMHVKMMEKKLVMDDATAAKFAPLYKEYLQAMKECRPAAPKDVKKAEKTDADIMKGIQDRFDARKKALDVQQKYFDKFKGILNAKQLEKVFSQHAMVHPKAGMKGKNMMKKNCPGADRMKRGNMGNPQCPFVKK